MMMAASKGFSVHTDKGKVGGEDRTPFETVEEKKTLRQRLQAELNSYLNYLLTINIRQIQFVEQSRVDCIR